MSIWRLFAILRLRYKVRISCLLRRDSRKAYSKTARTHFLSEHCTSVLRSLRRLSILRPPHPYTSKARNKSKGKQRGEHACRKQAQSASCGIQIVFGFCQHKTHKRNYRKTRYDFRSVFRRDFCRIFSVFRPDFS